MKNKYFLRTTAMMFVFVLIFPISISANTLRVPTDYLFIQDAINATTNGDTVLVAPGIYQENIFFGGRNIVIGSLMLTTGDSSYIPLTIIDGGANTNQSAVSFLNGEISSAVLCGLTIRNGVAKANHAGGITIVNAAPLVKDCHIIDNIGDAGPFNGIGVAVYNGDPTFLRCRIENNSSTGNANVPHQGAGIFISGGIPVFSNCIIRNNSIINAGFDRNHGGAVFVAGSAGQFINCLFENNAADRGGAVYMSGGSQTQTAAFVDCIFRNNTSKFEGAGFFFYFNFDQSVEITRSFLYGQQSWSGGWVIQGDFTNFSGGQITLNRCTMVDNPCPGISLIGGQRQVNNSIIYFNRGAEVGPGMTNLDFNYCNIQGQGGFGNGGFDSDPLFCNVPASNYNVAANSPCLGSGESGGIVGAGISDCPPIIPGIRRVPQDFSTIQNALNRAVSGDTVLLAPGNYPENIDFRGRQVVLASQYLSTGDTSFISQTIIDAGGQSKSLPGLWFRTQESGFNKVIGLTITNHYSRGNQQNGAIRIENIAFPVIEHCRIVNNQGAPENFDGIGVYIANAEPTFRHCDFFNNSGGQNANFDQRGGAVFVTGPFFQPRFYHCNFRENRLIPQPATFGARTWGGAVFSQESVFLDSCKFIGNSAGNGGAFAVSENAIIQAWSSTVSDNFSQFNGGVAATYNQGQIDLQRSLIIDNRAGLHGGAIYLENGNANLEFCTVSNNSAVRGGAIFRGAGAQQAFVNASIIYFNWPNEIGPDSSAIRYTGTSAVRNASGSNIIDADPLFIDWQNQDYRLALNSPAGKAGPANMPLGARPLALLEIFPQVHYIPGSFNTVQEAIRASYQGDTILVAPGNHAENLDFWGRRVLLSSYITLTGDTADIAATVIDGGGPGQNQSVLTFNRSEDSLSVIRGLTLTNGFADGTHAGGITIDRASPKIIDCRIVDNLGSAGYFEGIGMRITVASPLVSHCLIAGNTAPGNGNFDHRGGGIFIAAGAPRILNCEIRGNRISASPFYRNLGGGIYVLGSAGEIRSCRIIDNNADYGGGLFIDASPQIILQNNLVVSNYGRGNGGGLFINANDINVANHTFYGNFTDGGGGGIFSDLSDPSIINTILWANSAIAGDNEIAVFNGTATVNYSDVQGGWNGTGNIDLNPQFADTIDFYLSPGSPCIDAGHPDAQYNDPEDPNAPGQALFPAMGTLRSDIGAYGGSGSGRWIITTIDNRHSLSTQPNGFALYQNYPNPFNPTTVIRYSLPVVRSVKLKVFDMLGREVRTLVNERKQPGNYTVNWDGRNNDSRQVSSGIYLYRLQAGNFVQVRRMVLLR